MILWVYADHGGVGSYRVYAPALALEPLGYHSEFVDQRKIHAGVSLPSLIALSDPADAVVFQRAVGTVFQEWMGACREQGKKVVLELDDDLFHVPKHNPVGWFWGQSQVARSLQKDFAKADGVFVSTAPLARVIHEETGFRRDRIFWCPNHLPRALWGPHLTQFRQYAEDPSDRVVIGWQGSATHNVDFEPCADALADIMEKYPQVRLRFFGYVPPVLKNRLQANRFDFHHGVEFQAYPAHLHYLKFDIGIAPLVDSKFNRSKSNLKWLEYSALRVPCVASRVAPYAHSIEHAKTGFLAASRSEWVEHLSVLVESPELRRTVGAAAHEAVWSTYSPERAVKSWDNAFKTLGVMPCAEDTHAPTLAAVL